MYYYLKNMSTCLIYKRFLIANELILKQPYLYGLLLDITNLYNSSSVHYFVNNF